MLWQIRALILHQTIIRRLLKSQDHAVLRVINILGGEENIICYKNGQDRYPTEDIFLHEFFHG